MCVDGGEIDRNTSCDDCGSVDRVMSVAAFGVRGAVPSGSTVKGGSLLVDRMDGPLGESEIFIKYDELVV
jgi:hypothetical protein